MTEKELIRRALMGDKKAQEEQPMKTQEIIKALRTTPSRSKRALLDEVADKLEELQAENDALFRAAMDSRKESGLMDD